MKSKKPKLLKFKGASKPVKDFRDRYLTDMRLYHRITDWSDLWEQWYLSVDESGKPKYRKLMNFVQAVSESPQQKEFLFWYLGPPGVDEDLDKKFSYIPEGPLDWVEKRKTGGWFTQKNLQLFGHEITRRVKALDALRETGNKFTLNFVGRSAELAQRLDEEFKGTFFLPGLSLKANEERARMYIELHQKLLDYHSQACDLYAKAHGVNFEDMSGLVQLMTATTMATQIEASSSGQSLTKEQAVIKNLVEMVLVKASRHGIEMPPDAEAKIIETTAEVERVTPKKKVQ